MSRTVDLKEFLGAYLAEADEQLTLANKLLLEIDASLRENHANPRATRDLFRALHTLKGLSSMVGVEPIVSIAHRMESSLRIADREGGKLTTHAVDTLLKGIRAIEQRVLALGQKKAVALPSRELLAELDALETSSDASSVTISRALDLDPSLASRLLPFQLDALSAMYTDGRRALRVDFAPSPELAEKGLTINTVRERVGSIAEIIKVVPLSVARSREAPGGIAFALLLVSDASEDAIASSVGVPAERVLQLSAASRITPQPATSLDSPDPEADEESFAMQRRNIVRVDVQRLDDAMEQLSSLIVTRSRLVRVVGAMTEAGTNTRDLLQIVRENARQLRDLRAAILRVRMVPVAEVLDRVPLIVRGLRRDSGKQVRVVLDAGNAELDKAVAERIFPAIVHIVRNAIDHAVESPEERAAAGKPREATLSLSCTAHSNARLELTISDDGRGVDRAAVARRAGHEIARTDGALLDALCEPGISTRAEASTTSGRGMGMDIVKRVVVGQLGGELVMTTEPGRGTTFTIRVPLTIAIVDAFTMKCAGQSFVVPVSMVEEILEIDPAKVREAPRTALTRNDRLAGMIERRGEVIPLIDLARVFELPGAPVVQQALLVRRNGEPLAFGVDKVQGQQEAVVRPLIDPLVQVPGVSGATDLGDGKPTLVLDLISLGRALLAREGERAA